MILDHDNFLYHHVVLDTRNNTAKEFRSMTMEEIDTRLAYEY
jgi:hypothetical protein